MKYPTKKYTFTIGANANYQLLVGGAYFKIQTATGQVDVSSTWGKLENLVSGQGLQKTDYAYLNFQDKTGAPNTVTVIVGDENFIDTTGISTFTPLQATFANANKTVTNVSAQLVAANANRKYLLIQNLGAGDISLTFDGSGATVAAGLKLLSGGGSYEAALVVPTGQVNAIGSIANNPNIVVVEA